MAPTKLHRCYVAAHDFSPQLDHQESFCLTANHTNCRFYRQPVADAESTHSIVRPRASQAPHRSLWRVTPGRVVALFVIIAMIGLGIHSLTTALNQNDDRPMLIAVGDSTLPAGSGPASPSEPAMHASTATMTPVPPVVATEPVAHSDTPTSATTESLLPDRYFTPTPYPDGQVFTLRPLNGMAGWWSSEGLLRNHLGDSYLYAGNFAGQTYVAGAQFDLAQVPRGATIHYAELRLTGLRDDRLAGNVDGTWLVQLVPPSSLPDYSGSDFLTFYSAPASILLFPQLRTADLARGGVNTWELDGPARQWIEQLLLDGASSVTVRIMAASDMQESLFAWDSGLGPETGGSGATLVLSVGAAPPTPPPLPTKSVLVATLTPVPENVVTAVALAETATIEAYFFGTPTPLPYQVVTPTPFPENLATVQAAAIAQGLPPVLLSTPVPENRATAEYLAEYATAVALTTGTFTPVPESFVTPMLIYPPPPPENVATAAARVIQATAIAASGANTPTPPPYNAVPAIYAWATETPANVETASALVQQRNAAAATTGTPTPTPWNLVVITRVPEPTATEIPLVVDAQSLTPTPTATATRVVSDADLAQFRNKILFLSDRSGSTQIWVMDPDSGEVTSLITDSQLMTLARRIMLSNSPSGSEQAIVEADNNRDLQIKIYSPQYDTRRQITTFRDAISYDPAWSPTGDRIAFVSTYPGNDEIFTVDTEGNATQRLTFNQWEWDKHPTWSPDGSRIAFYSNRDSGRLQIWIMNADGANQRNLSNSTYNDWDPIWIR